MNTRHLSRRTRATAAAGIATAMLALAACGSESDTDDGDAGAGGSGDWETVEIEHAFGTTEITEEPQRVVTWGWASNDAAIALGTVPVAMPTQSYGGDEEGVLPWNREAIEAAGADMPMLLSESDEPPYEEILTAEPDLILAHYSGLTEEQYERLSAIADVVAYPDEAWSTPWRDIVTITGEALGKPDEAEQVLADIDAEVAATAEEHPEFEGTSIAAVSAATDAFYVFNDADPRVQFFSDLGFDVAESVSELDTGESTFSYTLSPENTDQLTSDVLVQYSDDDSGEQTFMDAASTRAMEQYDADSIALVTGETLVSSVSPPTALSATYGLDEVADLLSAAIAGNGAGAGSAG